MFVDVSSGTLYVAACSKRVILSVPYQGVAAIVAGIVSDNDLFCGDGGPATSACFAQPRAVVVDATGNIWIADLLNNRIRVVTSSTGIINTFIITYCGDTDSTLLCTPYSMALDSEKGIIYYGITGNWFGYGGKIRAVSIQPGSTPYTIAGTGVYGVPYTGDFGPATSATLSSPYGLALDSRGNIFVTDWLHDCVHYIRQSTNIIYTIAGSCGTSGSSGDNGPSTSATMHGPYGIAVDETNHRILICEYYNNVVRSVQTTPVVVRNDGIIPTGQPTRQPSTRPTARQHQVT